MDTYTIIEDSVYFIILDVIITRGNKVTYLSFYFIFWFIDSVTCYLPTLLYLINVSESEPYIT